MADVLVALDGSSPAAARLLASLGGAGFRSDVVADPRRAEHAARTARFDAVVFDAGPGGRDLVERLRHAHPAHVLVGWLDSYSSALAAELLERGADEVLHSGMGEREIAARLTASLRRAGRLPPARLDLGLLRLDALHGEATWSGRDLGLTRREREVLQVLAQTPGRAVRREVVYRRVWGYAMPRGDRSVDVNVKRVREKLARAGGDVEIATQPGVGYRLELPVHTEPAAPTPSPVTGL